MVIVGLGGLVFVPELGFFFPGDSVWKHVIVGANVPVLWIELKFKLGRYWFHLGVDSFAILGWDGEPGVLDGDGRVGGLYVVVLDWFGGDGERKEEEGCTEQFGGEMAHGGEGWILFA